MSLFAGFSQYRQHRYRLFPVLLAALAFASLYACTAPDAHLPKHRTPNQAAVASAHPLATQAGLDILAEGGNAFDAAVAVAASLGVVEPYSAGLGGGGFWLLYLANKQEYRFIDARETAPQAAHADYFLNNDGSVNRDRAINGPTAAAIPGQPAAFDWITRQYGQLPLARSLSAAINQASNGFAVDDHYRKMMGFRQEAVRRYPASAAQFLDNNHIPATGFILRQPDLATTLSRLAEDGHKGFYRGKTAKNLVEGVQAAGGDWTQQDLETYQVVERSPIIVRLGTQTLISAPPPSSGGIALGEMLQMLAHYPWQDMSSAEQTHLITEVMRRAYYDRAHYLGDPDFIDIPTTRLLSPQHIKHWLQDLDLQHASSSEQLGEPRTLDEGFHTTHLSVIDQQGNMVSATLSINLPFGSAFTAPGTGVLLNNEMDDFSASPGAGNTYGLTGNNANAIAPGKRPLSSMSPSILMSHDQAAIIGTPGGSRIITMVLLAMLEHLQGKPVQDWVERPRFHHQYLPDQLEYEPGALTANDIHSLTGMSHQLKESSRRYGNMQAILWDRNSGEVTAASDPRGIGTARLLPATAQTTKD